MYDSLIIPFQIGFVNRFTQIYPYPSKSEYAKCPKKVAKRFRTCYNNRIKYNKKKSMHSGYSNFPRLRRGNVGTPHAGKQRQRRCIRRPFGFSPPTNGKPRRALDTAAAAQGPQNSIIFSGRCASPRKRIGTPQISPNLAAAQRPRAAAPSSVTIRTLPRCRRGNLKLLEKKHIVAGRRPPLRGPARFDRKGTKQQWHFCTHSAAA